MVLEDNEIYTYDADRQAQFISTAPWVHDPNYFKHVRISAVALLKMVMHAHSGGKIEVMGMMQGRVEPHTFIIMDSFPLPVEATEVRVNAGAEAYEYMLTTLSRNERVFKSENVVGWYHSHPGYGCWLSGIDVSTQLQYQQFQDPFLAIVIDPIRTISSGKVNIGAFRTYPIDYRRPDDSTDQYQTIPLEKIEDFGVHCKAYYSIQISIFKSSLSSVLLDQLWNKYWVSALTSSSMVGNEYSVVQLNDLMDKMGRIEAGIANPQIVFPQDVRTEESPISKLSKDCCKASVDHLNRLMSQLIKHSVFNFNSHRTHFPS